MENIILTSIDIDSLEKIIKNSVAAAIASSIPETTSKDNEQTFSISELAEYLKVTKATIHAYKKRGVFKFYQTGRTVYFIKSEVDAALKIENNKK
ncbi:helix-turn-helix domain-containing protein [Pedobacter xixiisoli]|uniref:DNA binding domain-containing protein, excisionase family n=1 Tax=Pedobacter xixiisoli TaxID=1476464 RepID=A0A285ZRW0_9SPHI|nr:helix-turn-helix domain-containing protein [Pedobacter xixiisoli]SOD12393.1 DNA binding domain-containing protein, excisionase family [Pedobacter xixiisoli]